MADPNRTTVNGGLFSLFFFSMVGSPEYRKMLPESKGSLSKELMKDGEA